MVDVLWRLDKCMCRVSCVFVFVGKHSTAHNNAISRFSRLSSAAFIWRMCVCVVVCVCVCLDFRLAEFVYTFFSPAATGPLIISF